MLSRSSLSNFWCGTPARTVLAVLALLVLASCSNSKLILGPLYNRLDDQMRDEFNKLGKFNSTQVSAFEDRLQTFHLWHRRNELPRYAALLDEVEAAISVPRKKTLAEVQQWSDQLEEFSVAARSCHPVNFSFDLMKTLSDKQIDFIERRFAREQRRNRARYEERTPEERIDRRYKNVLKWSGRIGLDFNNTQKTLLRSALKEQISLRKQYWGLTSLWNREFFIIGRNQQAPDYDERMENHLEKLWSLLETNQREQWQANRDLWANFAVDFVNNMDTNQREWADAWLGKLSKTLRNISDDSVDFKPKDDPKLGCQ